MLSIEMCTATSPLPIQANKELLLEGYQFQSWMQGNTLKIAFLLAKMACTCSANQGGYILQWNSANLQN